MHKLRRQARERRDPSNVYATTQGYVVNLSTEVGRGVKNIQNLVYVVCVWPQSYGPLSYPNKYLDPLFIEVGFIDEKNFNMTSYFLNS